MMIIETKHGHSPVYHVAFVLLENFSMMAFTGIVDTIVTANLLSDYKCFDFTFYAESGESAQSDLNIDVSVNGDYKQIKPTQVDILLVCGGLRTNLETHPRLISVLQQTARLNRQIGGIWNGSYVMAQAGILQGHECTIHPENHALMIEVFPGINVSKKPFVIDRGRLSSAGATSTLSMMLNLIGQLTNEDLKHQVENILNVDRVLGESSDGSLTMLPSDPTLPASLREALQQMEARIDDPVTAIQLADAVKLSRRQLERLFQKYLNTSPAKYYLELRLTRAHQLLRQSKASILNIAIACGFSSSTHFSHCFRGHYGISPSVVRNQCRKF